MLEKQGAHRGGTALRLFRRQGYNGTGVKQIGRPRPPPRSARSTTSSPAARSSSAPRSSAPPGSALCSCRGWTSPRTRRTCTGAFADFFDGAAETLRETGYADACPIATVALEVASTNETLRQATADVFESWIKSATSASYPPASPTSTHTSCNQPNRRARGRLPAAATHARRPEPMDITGAGAAMATVQAALTQSA